MRPTKGVKERVDRLEKVVHILAEDQVSLRRLIAELARETRRGFDQVKDRFNQVEERFNQVEDRFNQVEERFNQVSEEFRKRDARAAKTDERIDKLVIAIGEFIRTRNGKR